MKKNLQEYALLAEIVSAISIVLSLIFVGIQIGQGADETAANTRAVNGQVRESMMNVEINLLSLVAEHPYLYDLAFFPLKERLRKRFIVPMHIS